MTNPAATPSSPVIPHFRRILFPTDFSPTADRAFDFALRVATRNPGSVLHLLHVIPEPSAQFWRGYINAVDEDVDANARREIDEKIATTYRPLVPETVPFTVSFLIGEASQKILEYAAETHPDLLVIGRQGVGTAVGKLLYGNVAERVVRKSPCPILVIPPA